MSLIVTPEILASAASGKIVVSDGTRWAASTPTFPNASATSGKTIRSDGTNWIASTATLSDTPSTSGKILKSDGTNWITSTETYAVPGTSGNVLTSDGTNWTSAALAVGGTTSKVTGSDFTTTSTTLVNITGLTFAALANNKYEVDALLICQSTSTAGMNLTVAYSAAGASGGWWAAGFGTGNVGVQDASVIGTCPGNVNFITVANTTYIINVKAAVVIGANAGNITVQTKKLTSGTATVYIGSRLTVTKLT